MFRFNSRCDYINELKKLAGQDSPCEFYTKYEELADEFIEFCEVSGSGE